MKGGINIKPQFIVYLLFTVACGQDWGSAPWQGHYQTTNDYSQNLHGNRETGPQQPVRPQPGTLYCKYLFTSGKLRIGHHQSFQLDDVLIAMVYWNFFLFDKEFSNFFGLGYTFIWVNKYM